MSFVNTSSQIITEQTTAHLTPQAGYIFTGVFAILIFASVVGQWLKRKNGADNATISNLNARIYAWWLMTLVLLVAFWFGKTGTVALFFLISFAALREFMTLVYRRRSDYYSMVVWCNIISSMTAGMACSAFSSPCTGFWYCRLSPA